MGILKKLRSFVAPSNNTSDFPVHNKSKQDPKFTETGSSSAVNKDPYQEIALEPYTDPKDLQISLSPVAEEEWELYSSDKYVEASKNIDPMESMEDDHSAYDNLPLVPDYLDHSESDLSEFEAAGSHGSIGLPETEKVSAILPPELSNEDPFSEHAISESAYQQGASNVFISSRLRIGAQAAPRLSLALVPVAIPSPISYALVYREQIHHLKNRTDAETDQERLLQLYTDYTQLVPNDIEIWNDYSNLLIELRGLNLPINKSKKHSVKHVMIPHIYSCLLTYHVACVTIMRLGTTSLF